MDSSNTLSSLFPHLSSILAYPCITEIGVLSSWEASDTNLACCLYESLILSNNLFIASSNPWNSLSSIFILSSEVTGLILDIAFSKLWNFSSSKSKLLSLLVVSAISLRGLKVLLTFDVPKIISSNKNIPSAIPNIIIIFLILYRNSLASLTIVFPLSQITVYVAVSIG